jgi:hypothetical protein
MDVPILHRMRSEFDHRNLWLQLLLGLLAAGERLDALLDRHAPARGGEPVGAEDDDADDATVALVLGLVAVTARVRATLEDAAHDVALHAGDPLASPPRTGLPRHVLR